jgi:TolB-like protein
MAARVGSVPAVLLALLCAPAPAAPAAGPPSLAVLPFGARGAPPHAWSGIWPLLHEELRARGYEVAGPDAVDAALKARRLRDTSLLTLEELRGLASALGVERFLLGFTYRYDDGPSAAVSLSARILDPDRLGIERMEVAVVEGRDLLGPMGTGPPATRERAAREAVRRIVAGLGGDGAGGGADGGGLARASALAPDPAFYLAARLPGAGIRRVAVLPFRNPSGRSGAGQAAADLVAWRLIRSGLVSVVDAGDAARRLLARGWRTGSPVGRAEVLALGSDLGVDAVVMGSVERWIEADAAGTRPPEVAISARLLDARDGGILWAADHERRGDQTRIVYDVGNVRLAEVLMARAASEALAPLLGALEAASLNGTGGTSR